MKHDCIILDADHKVVLMETGYKYYIAPNRLQNKTKFIQSLTLFKLCRWCSRICSFPFSNLWAFFRNIRQRLVACFLFPCCLMLLRGPLFKMSENKPPFCLFLFTILLFLMSKTNMFLLQLWIEFHIVTWKLKATVAECCYAMAQQTSHYCICAYVLDSRRAVSTSVS
jgi:hypothetical protein